MRKLLIIILLLVAPFIFFSFLSNTEGGKDKQLKIFFDERLSQQSYIVRDITRGFKHLEEEGYTLSFNSFKPQQINSFVMSTPDALYITVDEIDSAQYEWESIDYHSVKVAVTNQECEIDSITEKDFNELLVYSYERDTEISKKVQSGKIPIGIISFHRLNLRLKPLRVNGVYPSLENIRSGAYTKAYTLHIHMRKDNPLNARKDSLFPDNLDLAMKKAFSLIAGGDIMLSRGTGRYIQRYGPRYPFAEIRHEIMKHEIAFANLESPISVRGSKFKPNKGIYFRADPSVILGLKYSGFDVFSLANNHTLDWGIEAAVDTMDLLKVNELQYSGIGSTREEAHKPAVVSVHGTRIAFVSYNDVYPFSIKAGARSMETLTLRNADFDNEIGSIKEEYDVVVVSVHSGIEYIEEPETEKVQTMQRLIDHGADIVLGTHPHVIQRIETYKDGLIAYSLGNLVFDQNWSLKTRRGLLLEVGFLKKKPLYYRPLIVDIAEGQAKIVQESDSIYFVRNPYQEKMTYEYAKH